MGVVVADDQLNKLLEVMPSIAETVNRFESPEAQCLVLYLLIDAADADNSQSGRFDRMLRFLDSEAPALRSQISLQDLLGKDGFADVMEKLTAASKRWSDEVAPDLDAFSPDELRKLADKAGRGESVSLNRT